MPRDNLEISLRESLENKWFHSIRFSDELVSKGRFSETRPQNYTVYGVLHYLEHMDLQGMNCLDIGTMDGLVAFSLKQKGAKKVIATDMAEREEFKLGKSFLNLEVEYRHPVNIFDLPELLAGDKQDLIVCAGVLYHVFEPLTTLISCREQLKENGLLILETHYFFDESRPTILFSPSDAKRGSGNANTFFKPSYSALVGMIEMASFQVLSTISINGRITVLAKALKPQDVRSASPMIEQVCTSYMSYEHYKDKIDYNQLNEEGPLSTINCDLPSGHDYWISSSVYKSENPLNPVWAPSIKNRITRYLSDMSFRIKTSIARRGLLKNL